jgi:hypothetical protein
MKRLTFLLLLLTFIITPSAALAYDSGICSSALCSEDEVGAFMQNITRQCGNSGNCELTDIMTVFVNTGNYVIGIIGSIVLLMYVVGGLYFLTAAGSEKRISKGKEYLKISTMGLLIVMFAYLGIFTLRGVLQYGAVPSDDYVVCSGPETNGDSCDLNSTCTKDGLCVSACRQDHPNIVSTKEGPGGYVKYYDCADRNADNVSGCTSNRCPGDDDTQCCLVQVAN